MSRWGWTAVLLFWVLGYPAWSQTAEEKLRLRRQQEAQVLAAQARSYQEAGQYAKALPLYKRATELNPEVADWWHNRAWCHLQLGQTDKAAPWLKQARDLAPNDSSLYLTEGVLAFRQGRVSAAGKAFSLYILHRPQQAAGWVNRGNVYSEKQDWDRALADYQQALKLAPALPEARQGLALTLCRQEKYLEALPILEKLCLENPQQQGYWFNYGHALYQGGFYQLAVQALNRSLELNIRHADSFFIRALALFELGDRKTACKDCQRAQMGGHREAQKMYEKNCLR